MIHITPAQNPPGATSHHNEGVIPASPLSLTLGTTPRSHTGLEGHFSPGKWRCLCLEWSLACPLTVLRPREKRHLRGVAFSTSPALHAPLPAFFCIALVSVTRHPDVLTCWRAPEDGGACHCCGPKQGSALGLEPDGGLQTLLHQHEGKVLLWASGPRL